MAAEELPNEINKLKIAPDDENDTNFPNENAHQHKCRRCRLRRRSESTLDDYKSNLTVGSEITPESGPHIGRPCKHSHGLQHHKHTLKRTVISSSGDRKIYMREPMLRALQNCFCSSQNKVRRKLLPNDQETQSGSVQNNEDLAGKNQSNFPARGMTDFRSLIEECQSMLREITDEDKKKHNTQPFKCHRTPTNYKEPLTSGQQKRTTMTNNLLGGVEELSVQNISIPSAVEQSIIAPRSSTSCSQQAGNSSTVPCDDVNIDELASYFDTFVHIPKKMSTMAEMMYI